MKKWSLVLLGMIQLYTGCGTGQGEEITPESEAETEEAIMEEQSVREYEMDLRAQTGAPERTEFIANSEDGTFQVIVNADVIIPDSMQIPAAEVKRRRLAEMDLQIVKEAFLGAEEVEYTRSYEEMSVQELEEEILYLEKRMEEKAEGGHDREHYRARISRCKDEMETAKQQADSGEQVDFAFEWEGDLNKSFDIEGDIDGNRGRLEVVREIEGLDEIRESITFYIEELSERSIWFCYGETLDMEMSYRGENVDIKVTEMDCIYTEEEAVSMCIEILQKMGIDQEYEVNGIWKNAPFDTSKSSENDIQYNFIFDEKFNGYDISFGKVVNDITENYGSYPFQLIGKEDVGIPYFGIERMAFRVTNAGIIEFTWDYPMQVTGIKTEHVQLVSFESIEREFRDFVRRGKAWNEELGLMDEVIVDEIILGLKCVRNENNMDELMLIPVWEFYIDGESDFLYTINAIDGKLIHKGLGY